MLIVLVIASYLGFVLWNKKGFKYKEPIILG